MLWLDLLWQEKRDAERNLKFFHSSSPLRLIAMQFGAEERIKISCFKRWFIVVIESFAKSAEMVNRASEIAVFIHYFEVFAPLVVFGKLWWSIQDKSASKQTKYYL